MHIRYGLIASITDALKRSMAAYKDNSISQVFGGDSASPRYRSWVSGRFKSHWEELVPLTEAELAEIVKNQSRGEKV